MKRLRYENRALDAIDLGLIDALTTDARTSVAELARRVGLSAPSVGERIKRLEEAGVISGYSARIDPAAIGRPITAWLRIRPVPGKLSEVAAIIRRLPEISMCDRVTGEDCFIARAHVRAVADLESLIDEITPCAMTNTSIVQSSPVSPRLPPLESD